MRERQPVESGSENGILEFSSDPSLKPKEETPWAEKVLASKKIAQGEREGIDKYVGDWVWFDPKNPLTEEDQTGLRNKGFMAIEDPNNPDAIAYFKADEAFTQNRLDNAKKYNDNSVLLPNEMPETWQIDQSMVDRAAGVPSRSDERTIVSMQSKDEKQAIEDQKVKKKNNTDLAYYLIKTMGIKDTTVEELAKDEARLAELSLEDQRLNPNRKPESASMLSAEGIIEGVSDFFLGEEGANSTQLKWNEVIDYRNNLAGTKRAALAEDIRLADEKEELIKSGLNPDLANANRNAQLDNVGKLFLRDDEREVQEIKNEIYELNSLEELTDKQKERLKILNESLAYRQENKEVGTKNLFDPRTGKFISNTKDEQVLEFNKILDKEFFTYEKSDVGDLTKRRDDIYYQLQAEVMSILLNEQPKGRANLNIQRDDKGNIIPMTRDEIIAYAKTHSTSAWEGYGALLTGTKRKNSGDFSDWINILNAPYLYTDAQKEEANNLYARFIGINRALQLNEDPGSLKEGGFYEGLREGIGNQLGGNINEQYNKAEAVINELESMGYNLTEEQKKEKTQSFANSLGEATGTSFVIGAQIAAELAILKGAGGVAGVEKGISAISKILGGGSKAMTFAYEAALQGAAFEMAGESMAGGIGEHTTEMATKSMLEKLGSKNPYLNVFISTLGAGLGESASEYGGDFLDNIAEGYNLNEAALNTFGKTPEEAWEKFALTYTMSVMMSGPSVALKSFADANAQRMLSESGSNSPIVEAALELANSRIDEIPAGGGGEDKQVSRNKEIAMVEDALAISETTGEPAMVGNEIVTPETINEINEKYDNMEPETVSSDRFREVEREKMDAATQMNEVSAQRKELIDTNGSYDSMTPEQKAEYDKLGEEHKSLNEKFNALFDESLSLMETTEEVTTSKEVTAETIVEPEGAVAETTIEPAPTTKPTAELTNTVDEDKKADIEEKSKTEITPENSSNYANMTEDADGNFVFFHTGNKGYETIEPRSGGSATSRGEAAAIGKVGGVAMYHTNKESSE
ncbi:hypothetical protein KY337_05830 [Candidatus Woesearchaeota archaeon]|nr:hypothetical protein [Candidatus Woesearchaeota archaeon]